MKLSPTTNHKRLDQYLVQELAYSREKVKTLIKCRMVTLNGGTPKPSSSVQEGDHIVIDEPVVEEPAISPLLDFDMLYEDHDLLVINKQKGVLVHADHHREDTVVTYLKRQGVVLAPDAGDHREGIVHRLDRHTSGLMVVCKTNEAYHHLKQQFSNRAVSKLYIALVHGNLSHEEGMISYPIARHRTKRHLMTVSDHGKPAETMYTVCQRYNTKTKVEIRPLTGRTHQIRVHFSYIGHPLIQDAEYGPSKNGTGQCLQSVSLSFVHPRSGKKMTFSIPHLF